MSTTSRSPNSLALPKPICFPRNHFLRWELSARFAAGVFLSAPRSPIQAASPQNSFRRVTRFMSEPASWLFAQVEEPYPVRLVERPVERVRSCAVGRRSMVSAQHNRNNLCLGDSATIRLRASAGAGSSKTGEKNEEIYLARTSHFGAAPPLRTVRRSMFFLIIPSMFSSHAV